VWRRADQAAPLQRAYLPPRQGPIKAHSAPLHYPRPYGQVGTFSVTSCEGFSVQHITCLGIFYRFSRGRFLSFDLKIYGRNQRWSGEKLRPEGTCFAAANATSTSVLAIEDIRSESKLLEINCSCLLAKNQEMSIQLAK